MHRQKKFNGVALLAVGDEVVFSGAYGGDGAKPEMPLDVHCSFNLASVSKQFTAMGVVLLSHRSALRFDDSVATYIPELSSFKAVSIRHLLQHTSGMPDYIKHFALRCESDGPVTAAMVVDFLSSQKLKQNFSPGDRFQYSNTGYVLLAEIIERVSGVPFSEFMDEHIFRPLRMDSTQVFNLLSEQAPAHRVFGFRYRRFGKHRILHDLNCFDGLAGDGGIYASAHDLKLWHDALREGVLVPKSVYSEAYRPGVLNNGKKTRYGFGWVVNDDGSVEHAGGWQGFTSYIYRDLRQDKLIVLLDNSSNTLRVNGFGFRINSIGLNLKKLINSF
ncbi:MAG: serine hydrolase domain-containing protein [Thiotrichales bacterium]